MTQTARAWLGLLPFALTAVAIGAGGYRLSKVFDQEASDAIDALEQRHQSLELLAARMVMQDLERQLEARASSFSQVAQDPLADDSALLWIDAQGRTRLPRPQAHAATAQQPWVADAWAQWDAGDFAAPDPDVAARFGLLADLSQALAADNFKAVEDAFRRLLQHRLNHRLPAALDLATQVWALQALVAATQPAAGLCQTVLLHGVGKDAPQRLPGVHGAYVANRPRMHPADAATLLKQIVETSAACHVDVQALTQALARPPPAAWALPTAGTLALADGHRLLRRSSDGQWRGMEVDAAAATSRVQRQMMDAGLLRPMDSLAVPDRPMAVQTQTLAFPLRSPWMQQAGAEVRWRLSLKNGLLAFTFLAAAAAFSAAGLLFQRRHRYLALKSGFLAAVSHELRTPLASMRLLIETLQKRLYGDERARDYPARLLEDVDGLSAMVENLLSYNRLEKGRLKLQKTVVNVRELVEVAVQDTLSHTATAVELDINDVDDTAVRVDVPLVQLALQNVVRNAIQYNDRQPVKLRVWTAQDRGLCLYVRDNGRGIAATERQRVFAEFTRGGSAQARERGSGLGLALCRQVMTLHGGTVYVQDSSPEGTTFCMTLPRAESAA